MALNTSDPSAVRDAAHSILSQQQFTNHELTWWRQAMYYVTHPTALLVDVLDWIGAQFVGSGPSVVIAWLFVAIAAIALVIVIIMLTRSTTRDNVVPFGFAPNARNRTAAEFLADAEQCEREQQWRDAIRLRYSAVLADLGARGVVRLRPGRTTGEYLAESSANLPHAAEALQQATFIFERAWYGDEPPLLADVERFRASADVVRQKVAA